jgi:hypothetical protein
VDRANRVVSGVVHLSCLKYEWIGVLRSCFGRPQGCGLSENVKTAGGTCWFLSVSVGKGKSGARHGVDVVRVGRGSNVDE